MKKRLLVLLFILISFNVFSQKIKIDKKKGIMAIDNVDAVKFEEKKEKGGNQFYIYTDLNSNDFISIEMIRGDKELDRYYLITSSLSDKKSEMKYELIKFTLSNTSIINNLIVKKHRFITTDGINKTAIIDFLNTENFEFSEAISQREADQKARQELIDSYSPYINSNLVVTNKNTKEILAEIQQVPKTNSYYIIKNPQGDAYAEVKLEKDNYVLYTYDSKTYPYKEAFSKEPLLTAIELLIVNDYMGNDKNSYAVHKINISTENLKRSNEQKEREEQSKINEEENYKRSLVDGILTLTDGKVVKGNFRIGFRQTPEGILLPTISTLESDLDENTLRHYYKDDQGKDKVKLYKLNEMDSFEVVSQKNNNERELYMKIKYVEEPSPSNTNNKNGIVIDDNALDVVASGINLLKGKTKPKSKEKTTIAYIALNKKNIVLFFHYEDILIGDRRTNRTIKLNKENYESQILNLAEGCSSLIENIKRGQFKYTRESMLDFANQLELCN